MGKVLNPESRAKGLLKGLGGTVKTCLRGQGFSCAAEALLLAFFYYLIVKAISPLVIKGEAPKLNLLYLACFLVLGRLALGLIIARLNAKISLVVQTALKKGLVLEILKQGVFSKAYSKNLVVLVSEVADNILPYFTSYLKGRKKAIAFPILMWTAVLWASPLSALVLLGIAPLIPIFMILIGKLTYRLSLRQLAALTKLSERFYQSFLNLPLIRLYGLELRQGEIIRRASKRWRVETLQILYVAFLSAAALEFFSTVGVALCAILLGFAIYEGGFPYEAALFVLFCVPEFFAPLRNLGSFYHQRQAAIAAAVKIAELLECGQSSGKEKPAGLFSAKEPTEISRNNSFSTKIDNFAEHKPTDLERSHSFSHKLHTCRELIVENLSASYPDGRLGLKDFSAQIKLGTVSAVTGPSGAGKSSLLLTLFNKLKVTEGQILLGGEDYFALYSEDKAAFVPQLPHLFYGTLRDNLTLFDKTVSDELLLKRLKQVGALELLEKFPQGLDKRVGEAQRLISGGQLRLIALMRTMLKDADLIFMDEPTASLDEDSEKLFLETMLRIYKGRTVLISSHRPLTLSYCSEEIAIAGK